MNNKITKVELYEILKNIINEVNSNITNETLLDISIEDLISEIKNEINYKDGMEITETNLYEYFDILLMRHKQNALKKIKKQSKNILKYLNQTNRI